MSHRYDRLPSLHLHRLKSGNSERALLESMHTNTLGTENIVDQEIRQLVFLWEQGQSLPPNCRDGRRSGGFSTMNELASCHSLVGRDITEVGHTVNGKR